MRLKQTSTSRASVWAEALGSTVCSKRPGYRPVSAFLRSACYDQAGLASANGSRLQVLIGVLS